MNALKQLAVTGFLRDICRLPTDWTKQFDRGVTVTAMLAKGTYKAMSPATYKDNYRAPLGAFLADSLRDHGDDGFPFRTVEQSEYSGTRLADEDQQWALMATELQTLLRVSSSWHLLTTLNVKRFIGLL